MAKNKRGCRRSSRVPGLPFKFNYHSTKAYKRAKVREKIAKKSRRTARR